jgi:ABC-type polysaccharide/polyol phosphate transport system, ATPase component
LRGSVAAWRTGFSVTVGLNQPIGIVADGIVVSFPIFNAAHRSLKRTVLHATTGGRVARESGSRVSVCALDRLSFHIRPGDRVGLIGHNGSGKTTLLRVLSGVYEPVYGRISVQGRVASLLDLSLGMDLEATGYENIRLRAILAGLTPAEVQAKLEEIGEFSELDEYLEMPIRTYSSGMMLRLAFAVSTSVNADILLMDEWLGVGDADFSKKATRRLEELVDRSPILVIASHDPKLIARTCTRVLRLEHGVIVEELQGRQLQALAA